MVEPLPLRGMDPDERQILKEAVCDAILERTRRVVSGAGESGRYVIGSKPSRVLSSGFILPRHDQGGDDESNDIRIASHGLDLRVRESSGNLEITPTLSVYIRVLPSAEDLFEREGRLIPRAELSGDAKATVNKQIKRLMAERGPIPKGKAYAELRAEIAAQVHKSMGILVPEGAVIVPDDDGTQQSQDDAPSTVPISTRLRIPNALSRKYETPAKWRRVDVATDALVLPLPVNVGAWEAMADAYSQQIGLAIREACVSFLATDEGQAWAWRRGRPESEDFWSPDAWNAFLDRIRRNPPVPADLIPPIQAKLLVQALQDVTAPGCHSLRLALENLLETDAKLESGLFGVSLTVRLPEDALAPMRLERVKRSYHLNGFMNMPAIGVNGGVDDVGVSDGTRTLRTTWMPRYVLPRMLARDIPTVPTEYVRLSDPKLPVGQLRGVVAEMDAWREHVRQTTDLTLRSDEGDAIDESRQREQFQNDLNAWNYEARRVELGIETLERSQRAWSQDPQSPSAIPYKAWLLLNETFNRANPSRKGDRPSGWRLFQLAFILAHVPTLSSRLPDFHDVFRADFDEEAVSLLYMSTGGGKTEAFFGTVVFGLFLDRLRGKHRGVTAMLHYPLRLLTVQQAQRLARLLAQAELVRAREGVAGAPFEIGFWVGGGNTPNRTEKRPGVVSDEVAAVPAWNSARASDEEALLDGSAPGIRGYPAAHSAWNKLPTCPFCRSDVPTALRLFPEEHNRLGIVCRNSHCDWNILHRTSGRPVPLPFLLTDMDIYRRAPSILLGTIDKLALIGQNTYTIDSIAGMFGLARAVEQGGAKLLVRATGQDLEQVGNGGINGVSPAYNGGEELFLDPFPSLIIQDEMHLLEESLGTFGGIFETGLFAWLRRLALLLGNRSARVPGAPDVARLPHVIGATATVSDAAKHARALYQRKVCQFPHPGPSLHSTFYSGIASFAGDGVGSDRAGVIEEISAHPRDREQAAPWARLYASIMTNGRLHTVTTISVLAAHAATITRWQRDLASSDPVRQQRAVDEIRDCISDAPYSAARRSAVQSAGSGNIDRLAALIDLHRIELTYVTNKKGGDQILSALNAEAYEAHAAMGNDYTLTGFLTELISGGVDIAGIQRVIRSAEAPFDPMADDISEALRIIVATSAISHGVDVEAFNSMAFAGMPSDIAEYIQASSRVGRTHVGFSLLVPTPQTRRDRFVVEVHESFHRLLERMISPPAIERWADRAIERTVPSLLQTWLAGVYFQTKFVNAPVQGKQNVAFPHSVEQLERVLSDPAQLRDCANFIREAIGIEAPEGGAQNQNYYADLVSQQLRLITNEASSGRFNGQLDKFWGNGLTGLKKPMSSLRDVDAAGKIEPEQYTEREILAAAMAFVRNRGTKRAAGNELDRED
ncbi:helicase-related protein [Pelagibacterium sp. 26DY04]|uniref:DEAD/DEAH box helicase family protein n=1 Tax=Pelagibacterium sp. 26DY04 TaxID=2967130 RepID=UPI0028167C59|nr:DEAD/DEAH box helicase family protein [Pelagibacterium sp. 26DY04]WMT87492.1 helicase-related protein [Pelagibacterium sp. 26DY04]